jgi:hypothetical protein
MVSRKADKALHKINTQHVPLESGGKRTRKASGHMSFFFSSSEMM